VPGAGTSREPASAEGLLQHRGEPGDGMGLPGRQFGQLRIGRRQLRIVAADPFPIIDQREDSQKEIFFDAASRAAERHRGRASLLVDLAGESTSFSRPGRKSSALENPHRGSR
jgi:hypothetical protein